MIALAHIVVRLLADLAGLVVLTLRPRQSVQAENLFLRRELALYLERGIKPWRVKSRPGRPPIPLELRQLIRRMATQNPLWGEERIANELLLKLGLRVSPRTVRKYMPKRPPGRPRGDQRWATCLRNHAGAIVACDFFVAVTAHPSAAWTLQQLREVVGFDHARQYLIHYRDSIFARNLDESIRNLGLAVLKSPPHSPKANAICERVIGTIRRECLDWLIPLSESHLRSILSAWVGHYNHGRPHMALGPGVPDPPSVVVPSATPLTRHRIGERLGVRARSVLGGLHHEYLPAAALA